MRVLLLQPPGYHGEAIHHYMPPLGMAYLAAVLLEKGYEVKIIDFYSHQLWDNREQLISDYQPDVVGISCMTTVFPQAVKLARFCRQSLNPLIVYGGAHPSGAPESPLRDGYADISVIGYGEEVFFRICQSYEKREGWGHIPNICFKKDGRMARARTDFRFDVNKVPHPRRDFLDMERYPTYIDSPVYGRIEANTICGSRGCPYRCTFCLARVFGRWDRRDVNDLCDEIEELQKAFPKEGLFFYDLLFTVRSDWVVELCKAMMARGLDHLKWYVMGKVNAVDEELLNWMRKAGCIMISYGAEALSDEVLAAIEKRQTSQEIERAIRLTYECGITPMAHFMVGLPGQTEEMLWQDLERIEEWILKYNLYAGDFYPVLLFPGTPLFKACPEYQGHNWLDDVSPGFIFKNIPIYSDRIPQERLLDLSDELNSRCRKLLAATSNIYNVQVRKRKA